MKHYYRIAELLVTMDSFGRTADQARAYQCEACSTADIEIISPWEANKEKYPYLSDDVGEYLATGSFFYKELLNYDGFMLHASAVVMDGKVYLFTADSGTGKSTHTGLWLKQFGNCAFILNDDKPALRCMDGKWYAFGTPWSGKHDISVNARVPVAGIAIIERGEVNQIERIGGVDAVSSILRQSNRPKEAKSRIQLLELLDRLISQVPIWKLKCNMDPEAAIVSYEAMSGEKWRK